MNYLALAYRWCVYAVDLDDGNGQTDWRRSALSATKLCGYLCVFVGLGLTVVHRGASAGANTLVAMGISALFGRSVWRNWLARNQWASTVSESRVVQEIVQRRKDGETEPSP